MAKNCFFFSKAGKWILCSLKSPQPLCLAAGRFFQVRSLWGWILALHFFRGELAFVPPLSHPVHSILVDTGYLCQKWCFSYFCGWVRIHHQALALCGCCWWCWCWRWWWWAMLMRLRKVLMMFSNRGWIACDGLIFFRCRWCVPFVMVILALKVLLMTDSEHVKVTRCCDFWLWTKMMCRFTADDAWKKAHNLHLHPNLQGSPRKHRKTTFWGLWGEPSTITSRPTNHYAWKQRFLEPENWRLQVGPAPCKVCSTFVFILRLTQEAPEAPPEELLKVGWENLSFWWPSIGSLGWRLNILVRSHLVGRFWL